MSASTSTATPEWWRTQLPALVFGIAIATLVLYFVTVAIKLQSLNDFYTEALPPYRLLDHGHVLAFLRTGPAYVGSLVLRAPLALFASAIGAGKVATYWLSAIPALIAPALLTAWLRATSGAQTHLGSPRSWRSLLRPLDLCMITPPAVLCLSGGHPEDILAAVGCIAAVALARRGSTRAAGVALGLALINTSWVLVVVPLVIALMPADRRIGGFVAFAVTAGVVLIPVTVIRATGGGNSGISSSLGAGSSGIFLSPQLLWWFGRDSWVARESHILLVLVCWLVTAGWWLYARRNGRTDRRTALMTLALLLFLRSALDPWDNIYYFVPFMFTLMTYEDPAGFPKLSWIYAILLLIVIPIKGALHPLGGNGHAAVFAAFALLTLGWFGWQVFSRSRPAATGVDYAAAGSRSTA